MKPAPPSPPTASVQAARAYRSSQSLTTWYCWQYATAALRVSLCNQFRRHTALYRLKTPPAHVAQVLHSMAEGLSAQAAARVFQLSETTVRSWLSRAGQHSHSLHDRLMRTLQLTHVQLDELRLKLRGAAEVAWLWVA